MYLRKLRNVTILSIQIDPNYHSAEGLQKQHKKKYSVECVRYMY